MICSSVKRFFTSNLRRLRDWTPNRRATQNRGDVGRIERLKGQLANVDSSTWRERFKSDVEEEVTQVKKVWEATWKEQCDGKRLIEDLSKSVVFQTKIRNFKIRMIKEMAINQADGWKTIERQLRGLFS